MQKMRFTVEYDIIYNFTEGESFDVGFYVVSGNIKDPAEGGAISGIAGVKTKISPWDIDLSAYSGGEYVGDGKGKIGETQPVAANDSPANKAQNRRVEFIKL